MNARHEESVAVEPLARGEVDLASFDALAEEAFPELALSAEKELERPFARIWVARVEGIRRAIGMLVTWHVADELHILNVATAVAMQRRGVARALMREALAYAAAHQVRLVLLEVRRSNRAALELYRGLGFAATGVRARYYSDGEDAIEMALLLDPETGLILPSEYSIALD